MAQAKSIIFLWEGTDKRGNRVSGEITSSDPTLAKAELRQQGIVPFKVRKKPISIFSQLQQAKITPMEIAILTRQLATMLKAGIPVVQALDILGKGATNPKLQSLIISIRTDIESGVNFSDALRKHPKYFNELFANLVAAGEQSGSLDNMLARIATYREKTESLKGKIKKALFYPTAIIIVAFLITAALLIFVVPQFEQVFQSFGAELPVPTQIVINLSEVFQKYWYIIFMAIAGAIAVLRHLKLHSKKFAYGVDKLLLRLPIIGIILTKATVARFARTLATTFAAGLPLVDALQAVAGASGNILYAEATLRIREEVATGKQIQLAVKETNLFPAMVVQMIAIGEESGSLEFMLSKVADFYEEEVDNAVDSLSSLLEPVIMVLLGVIIGGLVISMYLPIFQLGNVI